MENMEIMEVVISLLDRLGTIGLLLFFLFRCEQGKREKEDLLTDDWKRLRDREQ